MFTRKDRRAVRRQIKKRIRKKISGTGECPRLLVFRSQKHIYAQAVDDSTGRVLAAASTLDRDLRAESGSGGNVAAAEKVGGKIAERMLAIGCGQVTFDRSGYLYHGRVQALADAARKEGLKF